MSTSVLYGGRDGNVWTYNKYSNIYTKQWDGEYYSTWWDSDRCYRRNVLWTLNDLKWKLVPLADPSLTKVVIREVWTWKYLD